ncbi:MAG: DUF4149 domain-containing protein, partial [Nitrospirae bacterium]|nr:DUF4149 domain-containing protein [Nitrospirota bacterium]
GSLVFFSFVGAPAIFKSLPREQAGDLAGVIFPRYYLLGLICGLIALGSLIASSLMTRHWQTVGIVLLVVMVSATLYAGYGVAGKAREVKAEIRAAVDGPAKQALQQRFGALHRESVILNSIVLFLGIGVFLVTAVQLRL